MMYGPTENGYASSGALSAFSLSLSLSMRLSVYVSVSLPPGGQRINRDAMSAPFSSFLPQIFPRLL